MMEEIDLKKMPKHVAIIMDGNGRWAKSKNQPRSFGHSKGIDAVERALEVCREYNIEYLTLYAFSTENWNRPKLEVSTLMSLLISGLRKKLKKIIANDVKINTIGDIELLPEDVQKELQKVIDLTKGNKHTLTLALSYGSRQEIVRATKRISSLVKDNKLEIDDINEHVFGQNLYTNNLPEVDLLIRTSGEQRISNFLLWQISYAEIYFDKVLWPEFNKENFVNALISYQSRERRFGKTQEQILSK